MMGGRNNLMSTLNKTKANDRLNKSKSILHRRNTEQNAPLSFAKVEAP